MTRFVVRPTGPSDSDGYSVVDTNREDEKCSAQIGRGLTHYEAAHLAYMLGSVDAAGTIESTTRDDRRRRLLAVLAACADAHDDYLSDEEKRANREAHEKSAEQARKMPAALRECVRLLESGRSASKVPGARLAWIARRDEVVALAREALGE